MTRRSSSRHAGAIQDAPTTPAIEDGSSRSKKKLRKPTRRNSSALSSRSAEEEIAEDALVVRGVAGVKDALVRRKSMQQQQQFEEEQERQLYQQSQGGALSARDHAMEMAPALLNDPSVVAVRNLLARVQSICDEINCLTVGLSTFLTELQKTPEIFAAVGLSLAEIASMLTHIAPGAMVVLKAGFPAAFALLGSPHFAVIAGVAGAATVVVLGGYKIVKSIMAGADENMALAYGDLPDEAILEETVLGGAILGEVIETDRRIEASSSRVHHERVEELPPVAVPKLPKHERKQSMPAEDPITTGPKEESRWLKRSYSSVKKPEEKKEREKKERRHTSSVTSSSKEKEKEREKRRDKEQKEERRSKDRDSRERKLERRATATREGSSSSGVSSNRSGSSERPTIKSSKTSPAAIPGKEKKEKKKNVILKLFDGKSS